MLALVTKFTMLFIVFPIPWFETSSLEG